jgi:hypothetical protein
MLWLGWDSRSSSLSFRPLRSSEAAQRLPVWVEELRNSPSRDSRGSGRSSRCHFHPIRRTCDQGDTRSPCGRGNRRPPSRDRTARTAPPSGLFPRQLVRSRSAFSRGGDGRASARALDRSVLQTFSGRPNKKGVAWDFDGGGIVKTRQTPELMQLDLAAQKESPAAASSLPLSASRVETWS